MLYNRPLCHEKKNSITNDTLDPFGFRDYTRCMRRTHRQQCCKRQLHDAKSATLHDTSGQTQYSMSNAAAASSKNDCQDTVAKTWTVAWLKALLMATSPHWRLAMIRCLLNTYRRNVRPTCGVTHLNLPSNRTPSLPSVLYKNT